MGIIFCNYPEINIKNGGTAMKNYKHPSLIHCFHCSPLLTNRGLLVGIALEIEME
jgi:hypothetical protein